MRHVPDLLLKELERKKPHWTLDVGCGKGYLARQLREHNLINAYYGIDIKKQSSYCLKEISIIDFNTSAGHRYDFIICDQVIEHIQEQSKALVKMRSLLVKDGVLFISSIIKRSWAWYIYDGKLCPEHIREYRSLEEFKGILERHDFKIKHIRKRQFYLRFYIPVPGFFIVEVLCQAK